MAVASAVGHAAESRWLRSVIRFALLVLAFGFLWPADRSYHSLLVDPRGTYPPHALGWFVWVVEAAVVAFCFTLAAFMPAGRLTFHPLRAFAFAVVPVLGLLHLGVVAIWHWTWVPQLLLSYRFYMDPVPQALLAGLLGIALASGLCTKENARPARSNASRWA